VMLSKAEFGFLGVIVEKLTFYSFSSRRRHTIFSRDWSSDVCSSDLIIPKGYELVYGGQYENLERASSSLLLIVPITILAILVMLFMLFRNFKDVALTMICVLFALPGGFIALLSRGMYFNISAGVGFVSLAGIAVMTGILIIQGIKLKHESNLLDAIKKS